MKETKTNIKWVPDKSMPKHIRESIEVVNARKIIVPGKFIRDDRLSIKNGNIKSPPDGLGS